MAVKPSTYVTPEAASRALQVHEGLDGWLFLVGGSNRPLSAYRPSWKGWWRLRRWARLVDARARRCRALGCRYLHLVVPEKLTIYPEMAPVLGIDGRRGPSRALERLLRGHPAHVDAAGALLAGKAAGDMYLRTDTHWTLGGCHVAYRALCRALGVARPLDLADRPGLDHDLVGDLGAKLEPPRSEPTRRYGLLRDASRVHASRLVETFEQQGRPFALHRGAYVVYRNPQEGADPRRVLLFGDSCAHFEPFLLTGMLAETFREVHFVWSASIDWGLVERVRPDVVIGEIAERFMSRVPDDRYDVEAFAAEQLERAGFGEG